MFVIQKKYLYAIEFFEKGLELDKSLKVKDPLQKLQFITNIVDCYIAIGEYDKALKYYADLANLSVYLDDLDNMATTNWNISQEYFDAKEYNMAKNYALKTLAIYESLTIFRNMIRTQVVLGSLLMTKNQSKKGLEYLNQALFLSQRVNDKHSAAQIGVKLAKVHNSTNQSDAAINYAEDSMLYASENGELATYAQALIEKARAYKIKGDLEKAMVFYKESIELINNSNDKSSLDTIYFEYSKVLQQLDYVEESTIAMETAYLLSNKKANINPIILSSIISE
ncbi:tetratricopeptide repeat protein [Candidatus Roizmanbacteria bacterium]|nr:tetratricopeptide repeat protein [Candidatus Roizmanbacteria bacterium]